MKPIVIANWKMNEMSDEAQTLVAKINAGVAKLADKVDTVICPPFTALKAIGDIEPLKKGAQDIHWEDKGTFTGEVSGPMLVELGCEYVIIGHSDRRWKLGENDDIINKKLLAALRNKLIPVLCVGEQAVNRQDGRTKEVLHQQLESAWREIGREDFEEIIIAYEPVWAIGTGTVGSKDAATPEIVTEAYGFIQKFIAEENLAGKIKLIYGGSIDVDNVNEFFKVEENRGFLVGGASLVADQFIRIVKKTANNYV